MNNDYTVDEVIRCSNCGQPGARIRYLSRSYGTGETLLVIEHVPVISCPSCGESYLTAHTVQEIDRIKQQRLQRASTRPVAVAEFASAIL